jgi:4-diphosphocytidyl-2-C-methyl-D-erythritol kinase
VILFPNCKINLGLNITSKRLDGFHNLQSIVFPIPLRDAIEVVPSDKMNFFVSGIEIPGAEENNLCWKAYHLLKTRIPHLPPVSIYLHKRIPIGAGLGGGSSDGAFMLQLLNHQFKLNLSKSDLGQYALTLGSDCPFFMVNKPALVTSRGEIIDTIPLDLSGYSLILVHSSIPIDTAWAFSVLKALKNDLSLKDLIQQPLSSWKNVLVNDFEKPVFLKYPKLRSIRDRLYDHGAVYASMTGSGSSIYGIFENSFIPPIDFGSTAKVDIFKMTLP